jgi:hypothetical protein
MKLQVYCQAKVQHITQNLHCLVSSLVKTCLTCLDRPFSACYSSAYIYDIGFSHHL